ncbi:dipeptide/oligopeptide/nickel ABC transporter permease/ATP-binding protein [Galbitalea soli]|uniref:Dipeptide/oligopeptide/nickel ABC transporter permease/ATP-binding protein n=1 Tax=Galbitalea soli TaxID=1268042 RepID=A0A7C9PPN7_9MICO|nr:dipeptide/oligopeptide/nickel ABC transporter permease/ATP-binding protein [Galbitalea soli]NEM92271.1 dipeptide/oligopeptide/nickel ABC transporter permease/ATP-binding protein [Galbitalea soli]NYJ31773.1 peptide/nickel transport system permease protein [Galbitalea soli]
MTAPLATPAVVVERREPAARRRAPRLLRSPSGTLGLLWLLLIVLASATARLWLPYPTEKQDLTAVLQTPTAAHWLGTDELGRDLLSRIFAAGAGTLLTTSIAALVAVGVAVPLSLWSAGAGPRVEAVINRVTEIVMSVPGVVVMLAVIGAFGTNLPLVMAVLGFLISAGVYRVLVGQAKSLQANLYVDAARVDGVRPVAVSLRHILPNMLTTILVQFVLIFAIALMIGAGLAFIGFGPPPPEPSWGGLIGSASKHVYDAPWLMVPTGLVLILTVLAINAIADALSVGADAPPAQIALGRAARRRRPIAAVSPAPAGVTGLAVRDLAVGIDGGTTLVSSVSFDAPAGRVLGVVGESGCGKSLTALALMGLLPAGLSTTAGSIHWGGRELATLTEQQLGTIRGHEIGFVGQEPMRSLDPMFTIGYQLAGAVRRLRRVPAATARREAEALLGQVGIADPGRVLRSYPHQISGGMAQRVAIALALAGRPALVIADEPTTALDVTVQAEILSLLRSLVRETGMSLVIVTHDLGVVADICDSVVVMYAGQVVESGTVFDVLDDAQHPYTMALLAADPHAITDGTPASRLASIPGQVPQPKDWPGGCRFAARCEFARAECHAPVELEARSAGSGAVRCVRAVDLHLSATRWTSTGVSR